MVRQGGVILPPRDTVFACVPRGTLIAMSDESFRRIEDVRAGDLIRTYDAATHTVSAEGLEDVAQHDGHEHIVINGALRISPSQDVFCNGAYRKAATLQLGGVLVGQGNQGVTITSLERLPFDQEVFSIVLASGAGYFVRHPDSDVSLLIREARTGKMG